jgi:hypothetical protein
MTHLPNLRKDGCDQPDLWRMWNRFRILSLRNLPVSVSGVSVPDGAGLFKFQ